jgi:lipid II:glycine glycyltransferase (peptidoglycan interpeptide bridge formation enzyme)
MNRIQKQYRVDAGYEVKISNDLIDDEWDNFVRVTPGAHFTQTALWAQVQTTRDWHCLRIVIKTHEKIIGGAQILYKPLPVAGYLGYLTRGPVCDFSDIALVKIIFDEIRKARKNKHIEYLALTLPANGGTIDHLLPGMGFQVTEQQYCPLANVVIDLTQDTECIVSRMAREKRRKIHRLGRIKTLNLREGNQADIPTFYRLHSIGSQRIGFTPRPETYYQRLWEAFEPRGYLKLFLSEYENEPVSAILCIPYKDSVCAYVIGWSGAYGNLFPNDAVYWEAILWAKASGFSYFDFGGLSKETVRALQKNEPIPESEKDTYSRFKLDYCGDIYFYPENFDNIINPILNWGYRKVYPMVISKFGNSIAKLYNRLPNNVT